MSLFFRDFFSLMQFNDFRQAGYRQLVYLDK